MARAGAEAGCHEALFTLGDKPELRYRAAREELAALGCATTIEYLARMCELVLEETGLLPHVNPGVLHAAELARCGRSRLRRGSCSRPCRSGCPQRGGPHSARRTSFPAARWRRSRRPASGAIPFTTGILIGIGETREERLEALLAIRDLHERYGHVQEVIVQNFRAKPGTRMAAAPEPSLDELLWTARPRASCSGPTMHVQAPPNLSLRRLPAAARRRDRRLGRRLAGDARPREPGGAVARARAARARRPRQRARAGAAAPDLPGVRRRRSSAGARRRVAPRRADRADADGLAREAGWAAGS